jgi:hypothetical protein
MIIALDQLQGEQNVLLSLSAGFVNPISNKTIAGFSLVLADKNNQLIH